MKTDAKKKPIFTFTLIPSKYNMINGHLVEKTKSQKTYQTPILLERINDYSPTLFDLNNSIIVNDVNTIAHNDNVDYITSSEHLLRILPKSSSSSVLLMLECLPYGDDFFVVVLSPVT